MRPAPQQDGADQSVLGGLRDGGCAALICSSTCVSAAEDLEPEAKAITQSCYEANLAERRGASAWQKGL